jgi:proteasome lid subunit RPN8/RPN11
VRYAIEVPDPEATENAWTRDQHSAQVALDQALAHHRHPWLGYVGDWHSHPSTCAASSHDIAAIKRACGQYEQPLVLLVHRADNIVEAIVTQHRKRPPIRRLIETIRRTAAP